MKLSSETMKNPQVYCSIPDGAPPVEEPSMSKPSVVKSSDWTGVCTCPIERKVKHAIKIAVINSMTDCQRCITLILFCFINVFKADRLLPSLGITIPQTVSVCKIRKISRICLCNRKKRKRRE